MLTICPPTDKKIMSSYQEKIRKKKKKVGHVITEKYPSLNYIKVAISPLIDRSQQSQDVKCYSQIAERKYLFDKL